MFRTGGSLTVPGKVYSGQFRYKTVTKNISQTLQGQGQTIVWKVQKYVIFSDNPNRMYYYSLKLAEGTENQSNCKGYISLAPKSKISDGDPRNIERAAMNHRDFPDAHAFDINSEGAQGWPTKYELVFENNKALFDLLVFIRNSTQDATIKKLIVSYLGTKKQVPPWDTYIINQESIDATIDESPGFQTQSTLLQQNKTQSERKALHLFSPNAIYKNVKMSIMADPTKQIIFTGYLWKKGSFTTDSWKMRSFYVKENGVLLYYQIADDLVDDLSISNGTFRDHNVVKYEESQAKGRININNFYVRDGDSQNIRRCGCPTDTVGNPMVAIDISEKPFTAIFNPIIHNFVIPVEIAQSLFYIIENTIKSQSNNIDSFLKFRIDRLPWNWVRGGGSSESTVHVRDEGDRSTKQGGGNRENATVVRDRRSSMSSTMGANGSANEDTETLGKSQTSLLKQMRIDFVVATNNIQEKVHANTVYRGFFWKKGSYVNNWKQRSFEVKDDSMLYYFVFSQSNFHKSCKYDLSTLQSSSTVTASALKTHDKQQSSLGSSDNLEGLYSTSGATSGYTSGGENILLDYESFEDISLGDGPADQDKGGLPIRERQDELDGFKGMIDIHAFYVRDGDLANIERCGGRTVDDEPCVALDISNAPFNSNIFNISAAYMYIVLPVSFAKEFLSVVKQYSNENNIDRFLTAEKLQTFPWSLGEVVAPSTIDGVCTTRPQSVRGGVRRRSLNATGGTNMLPSGGACEGEEGDEEFFY